MPRRGDGAVIRRAVHFALNAAGFCLWLPCVMLGYCVMGLAILGHRVWPAADRGNCWSYALPRLARHGGKLQVEASKLRLGPLPIPHAIWVRPDGGTEQTEPIERRRAAASAWWGLATIYFRFRVKKRSQG